MNADEYTGFRVVSKDTITTSDIVGIKSKPIQLEGGQKYILQFKIINYSSVNILNHICLTDSTGEITVISDNLSIDSFSVVNTFTDEGITKQERLCYIIFTPPSTGEFQIGIGRNISNTDTANETLFDIRQIGCSKGEILQDFQYGTEELTELIRKYETFMEQTDQRIAMLVTTKDINEATAKFEIFSDEITSQIETMEGDYVTKTEFNQTNEDFTFKISQSGGGNLLKNTKFKNGTAHWHLWNWDSTNVTSKKYEILEPWTSWNYNKERALKVEGVVSSANKRICVGAYSDIVDVKPNTTYTFSCYADAHRADKIAFEVYSNENYPGTNNLRFFRSMGTFKEKWHEEFNTNYSQWHRVKYTFTTGANTTKVDIRFYMDYHDGNSQLYSHCWIALPCLVEGSMAMEWVPHENELYDGIVKIDDDGITVTQTASNNTYTNISASGFKSIHNNGSYTTMDANGLIVRHSDGSNTTMDADGFYVSHKDGSYTWANASGLMHYTSGTGKYYHYLQYAGEYICNSEAQVQITLPSEFKGKNFQVITAVKRIYVAYLDYISYARFPLLSFYAEARNINRSAGTFEIYASIRAWNRTGVSGMGTVVGTNDTAAETEAVKPVVAYWVYA